MAFLQRKLRGANRLVNSPVEHHAVSSTGRPVRESVGVQSDFLPSSTILRMVHPDEMGSFLKPDTAVVSVVYANNEIGRSIPSLKSARFVADTVFPFHTIHAGRRSSADGRPKRPGRFAGDWQHINSTGRRASGRYARRRASLLPIVTGGQQESGFHAGTQNIPYIVGLAEASGLAQEERGRGGT